MKPIEFVVTNGDNYNAPAGKLAEALEEEILVLVWLPGGAVVEATILSYYISSTSAGNHFILELETK